MGILQDLKRERAERKGYRKIVARKTKLAYRQEYAKAAEERARERARARAKGGGFGQKLATYAISKVTEPPKTSSRRTYPTRRKRTSSRRTYPTRRKKTSSRRTYPTRRKKTSSRRTYPVRKVIQEKKPQSFSEVLYGY